MATSLAQLPLDELCKQLKRMGVPGETLDNLASSPQGEKTLRSLFSPGGPFASSPLATAGGTAQDATDKMMNGLEAARTRYEKEKGMKPTKLPTAPRRLILEAATTARATVLPTKDQAMEVMTFSGVEKAFSTTPLSELSRGMSLPSVV